MSQTQQYKKVKLYRNLKVVFYVLGLPMFLVAVCLTAVKFLGHDPFMGSKTFTTSLGFFTQAEQYITAPALYGVWIGFGVWAFISIVHIILSNTVKNPRVRMFSVVAVCMAVMLGTGCVLDAVLEKKVTELQTQYEGTGVVVNDYKTQLSYYRTVSSNAAKKSDTYKLITQVDLMKNVYNVEMDGADKSGVAGNISNKPVTYYSVIDDEGNQGVDISFKKGDDNLYRLDVDESNGNTIKGDGDLASILDHSYRVGDEDNPYDYKQSPEYNQVIRLKPNSNGELVINGKTYSHYFYKMKTTKAGETIYVWYTKDLAPDSIDISDPANVTFPTRDGVYGTGIYNSNGMLSDGWVFSLDNVLNILDDYYSAQSEIEKNKYSTSMETLYAKALEARNSYYTGELKDPETDEYCPEWLQTLYSQEIEFADNFSLSRNGLDYLIAKVGALLGNNHLFDFLLKIGDDNGVDQVVSGLESFGISFMLSPILESLQTGASLKGAPFNVSDDVMATIVEWVKPLMAVDSAVEIHDLYLMVTYAGSKDGWGNDRNALYVALVKDGGAVTDASGNVTYPMGTDQRKASEGGDVLLDIDFSDAFVEVDEETGNVEYNFDLDHLSTFLNTALNGLMTKLGKTMPEIMDGTLGTILGLFIKEMDVDGETYYGLTISGIQIPLLDESKNFDIDVSRILLGILDGLYYYQSPAIKPVWEFYSWVATTKTEVAAAQAYQKYERANYEATTFGKTIGSTLIGDTLGAGTYPSALGLADLTAVRQLKADLSYKPTFYPLYGVRDMLFFFCGFVVMFYFLSFVAQEKELEYANGTAVVNEKKKRKKSKNKTKIDEQVAPDQAQNADIAAAEENPQIPAERNSDKEVL